MKRSVYLICAGLMALSLAACGSKTEETTAAFVPTRPSETQTQTAAAAETGAASMANPMVEITDTAEFGKELGISLDADMLFSEAKMFIIDGRIAECGFSFENIMGENVDVTLRATKDEAMAENLHGVYDSTLKEVQSLSYDYPFGSFTVTVQENDAQDTTIYTWQIDDTWYSVVLKGKPSQMEVAEVMDSIMLATGIETESFAAAEPEEETGAWYELTENDTVLTVRLSANATTGYQWNYKIWDENSLELIAENYAEDAHPDGMVGVGGTWTASFRATGADKRNNYTYPCRNYVTFKYARDWEDDAIDTRVIDLNIVEATLEIIGVHEPDFSAPQAADGEYAVTLSFTNMIQTDDLNCMALIGIPEIITFTDDDVKNLKAGDVIPLSVYGLYDVDVEYVKQIDEKNIEINECERFSYRDDLGAWVIVGLDDDIAQYNKEYRTVRFTNETVIDDGMEEVMKTGNTGGIYDKMGSYWYVDARITVKDGVAQKIRIYYHP